MAPQIPTVANATGRRDQALPILKDLSIPQADKDDLLREIESDQLNMSTLRTKLRALDIDPRDKARLWNVRFPPPPPKIAEPAPLPPPPDIEMEESIAPRIAGTIPGGALLYLEREEAALPSPPEAPKPSTTPDRTLREQELHNLPPPPKEAKPDKHPLEGIEVTIPSRVPLEDISVTLSPETLAERERVRARQETYRLTGRTELPPPPGPPERPPRETTLPEKSVAFVQGVLRGVAQLAPGLATVVVPGLEIGRQRLTGNLQPSRAAARERGIETAEKLRNAITDALPPNTDAGKWEQRLTQAVPEGIGTVGVALAASLFGGPITSAGVFATSMGGDSYAEAIRNGATHEQALSDFAFGFAAGATEVIPAERLLTLLKATGSPSILRRVAAGTLEQAPLEATQEFVQEVIQGAGPMVSGSDPNATWADLFSRAQEAGLIGGMVGGLVGGAGGSISLGTDVQEEFERAQREVADAEMQRRQEAINEQIRRRVDQEGAEGQQTTVKEEEAELPPPPEPEEKPAEPTPPPEPGPPEEAAPPVAPEPEGPPLQPTPPPLPAEAEPGFRAPVGQVTDALRAVGRDEEARYAEMVRDHLIRNDGEFIEEDLDDVITNLRPDQRRAIETQMEDIWYGTHGGETVTEEDWKINLNLRERQPAAKPEPEISEEAELPPPPTEGVQAPEVTAPANIIESDTGFTVRFSEELADDEARDAALAALAERGVDVETLSDPEFTGNLEGGVDVNVQLPKRPAPKVTPQLPPPPASPEAIAEEAEVELPPPPTAPPPRPAVPPVTQKLEETKERREWGSSNTITTTDAYEAARRRMRERLGKQLGMGVDPEYLQDFFTIGAYHFEAGAREFAEWSRLMIEDLGEKIRPMLQGQFDTIRAYIEEVEVNETRKRDAADKGGREVSEGGLEGPPTGVGPEVGGGERPVRPDTGVPPIEPTERGAESGPERAGSELRATGTGRRYSLIGKPAIELTKQQRREINRRVREIIADKNPGDPLTEEEQELLRQYTGAGGLQEAEEGVLFQHYTSYKVIDWQWNKLRAMGIPLEGANILEPAVGVGNYFGFAPQEANLYGVEVDPTAAKVARLLYPDTKVSEMPFEHYAAPGLFDVVISNVPFSASRGELRYSREAKEYKDITTLHDFFFIKSLDLLKPNGILSFITSTGTMDKQGEKMRREINKRAEFLGAYRLPAGTFQKNTQYGGSVDVIFLRARTPEEMTMMSKMVAEGQKDYGLQEEWVQSVKTEQFARKEGQPAATLSAYFQAHPEKVWGQMEAGYGVRQVTRIGVRPTAAIDTFMAGSINDDVEYSPLETSAVDFEMEDMPEAVGEAPADMRPGSLSIAEDGQFLFKMADGNLYEAEFPKAGKKTIERISAGVRMMDLTERLYRELGQNDLESANVTRSALRKELDAYQRTYKKSPGYDNYLWRFINGGPKTKPYPFADPRVYMLAGLTDDKGNLTDIFTKNTVYVPPPVAREFNPNDLLDTAAFVFETTGELRLEDIAGRFTGQQLSPSDVALRLVGQPGYSVESVAADGTVTPASDVDYLFGPIWTKIDQTESMMETVEAHPNAFEENVRQALVDQHARLLEALPEQATIDTLKPDPFASWVDDAIINDWIRSFNAAAVMEKEYDYKSGRWLWQFKRGTFEKFRYKDHDYSYKDLIQFLNHKKVKKPVGTGKLDSRGNEKVKMIFDPDGQARINLLHDHFVEWAQGHKQEFERLVPVYNRLYRGYRHRTFSEEAQRVNGLSDTFKGKVLEVKEHQWQVTAQMLKMRSGIIAHGVGGGKTMSSIIMMQIAKQKGQIRKPMVVVPAKVSKNWAFEANQLFPNSTIIDLTGLDAKNRYRLLQRVAANEADFVVISHDAFKMIPLRASEQYIEEDLKVYEERLRLAKKAQDRQSERMLQDMLRKKRETLAKLQDMKKTNTVWFEDLGVDSLVVDEAHNHKNAPTDYMDMRDWVQAADWSQQASDMVYKTRYIHERRGGRRGQNVWLLTATPTPNNPIEIYTMLKYVAPDEWTDRGIENAGDFVKQFGQVDTILEPTTTGVPAQRNIFRGYKNLKDLRSIFRKYVDLRDTGQFNIKRPDADYIDHIMDPSSEVIFEAARIAELDNFIRSNPKEAGLQGWNPLSLLTEARKLSADLAYYNPIKYSKTIGREGSKIRHLVSQLKDLDTGKNTQLVFADLYRAGYEVPVSEYEEEVERVKQGIIGQGRAVQHERGDEEAGPSEDVQEEAREAEEEEEKSKFVEIVNLHTWIRDELIRSGVPAEEIAIVNKTQNSTPDSKFKVQQRNADGKIRFIIGTTRSMGEGMNLQSDTTDVHHYDVPYNPAALDQREGRGVRQGNRNDRVRIHKYLMRGTSDSKMYAILARKAKWNRDLWEGDHDTVEDFDQDKDGQNFGDLSAETQINQTVLDTWSTVRAIQLATGEVPESEEKLDLIKKRVAALEQDMAEREQKIKEYEAQIQRGEGSDAIRQRIDGHRGQIENIRERHQIGLQDIQTREDDINATLAAVRDARDRLYTLVQDLKAQNFPVLEEHEALAKQKPPEPTPAEEGGLPPPPGVIEARAAEREDGELPPPPDEVSMMAEDGGLPPPPGQVSMTSDSGLPPPPGQPDPQTGERPGKIPVNEGQGVPPPPIPRQPDMTPKEIVRKSEILARLSERLNIPLRVGRFRQRARGIFKIKPEVARIKIANDIGTAAHEFGHAINKIMYGTITGRDIRLNWKPFQPFRSELKKIATKPHAGQSPLPEGFAEFIRLYLTTPAEAERKAPRFKKFFEGELERFPDLRDTLLEAQDSIRRWSEQPDVAKVLAHIQTDPTQARRFNWGQFYSDTIDRTEFIRKAVKALGDEGIPTEKNAHDLARLYAGWSAKAHHFLNAGTFEHKSLDITGRSLREILEPVENRLDEFKAYLVSRRDMEKSAQGIASMFEPGVNRRVVAQLEDSTFLRAAQELYTYQDELLQYMESGGILSSDQIERMRRMNQDYIPFYRVFDEAGDTVTMGAGAGFGNLPEPIKRMVGSGRDIADPLESVIKNTYTFIEITERNAVAQALMRQASATEGGGRIAERVPMEMRATSFELERIKDAMASAGIEITDEVDLQTIATVFFPNKLATGGKDRILSVFMNGERVFYEIGSKELYNALTGLDQETGNALIRLLAKPASLLRLGATGLSPEFIVRNPLRDAMTAYMQSQYGFIPVLDTGRGIFHALKRDDLYWEWRRAGGDHAALVSLDKEGLQEELGDLLSTPIGYAVRHPIQALRIFSEWTEAGTRIGEYRKARLAGETARTAALASREVSIDFARRGAVTQAINMIIPFWNASVQGMDKFARMHKADPIGTMRRGMIGITLPSILLYAVNRDDEEFHALPRWQRDFFWNIPTKWFPWLHEKTPFIPIPKPFEWGLIYGTAPERIAEWIDKRDRSAFDDMLGNMVEGVAPPYAPTVVTLPFEMWANKSFFTGRPIVPRHLQNLEPEFQWEYYTSEFSKMSSKVLAERFDIHVSPMQIDNAWFGLTGGFGRTVRSMSDWAVRPMIGSPQPPSPTMSDIPLIRAFAVRYPSGSLEPIQQFYNRLNELESRASTVAAVVRSPSAYQGRRIPTLSAFEQQELGQLQTAREMISDLQRQKRDAYANRNISRSDKRDLINGLELLVLATAQNAMLLSLASRQTEEQTGGLQPPPVAEPAGLPPPPQ